MLLSIHTNGGGPCKGQAGSGLVWKKKETHHKLAPQSLVLLLQESDLALPLTSMLNGVPHFAGTVLLFFPCHAQCNVVQLLLVLHNKSIAHQPMIL